MKTLLICILLLCIVPQTAFAKKGLFGKDERIVKLTDINLKDSKGEELYLAYKTTGLFIMFGAYLKNDGYVLGVKSKIGMYYPLDDEKIKELQSSGILPNPLPTYKIDFFDYLVGYSLWIVLFFTVGLRLLNYVFTKSKSGIYK